MCESGGQSYASMEATVGGGSAITRVVIDGSSMTSMSGDLPAFDNSAILHTIEVTAATWLDGLPLIQNQDSRCAADPTHGTHGIAALITAGTLPAGTPVDGASCPWTPSYTGLRSFTLDHSITPTTTDGLVFAVHPTLHVGDFHGHRDLATLSLQNNNLKGDLPNVDDPHGDDDDDLTVYLLNHNSFGGADCIDRSAGSTGAVDCVPDTFQYLHRLSSFQLMNNNMAGSVSMVFFTLAHMQSLDLSHNGYTGFAESTICTTFADCSCTSGGDLFDLYHRQVMDPCPTNRAGCPSGVRIPDVATPAGSNALFDISYNSLTELPMYMLRGFKKIHAASNQISAEGTLAKTVWDDVSHGIQLQSLWRIPAAAVS